MKIEKNIRHLSLIVIGIVSIVGTASGQIIAPSDPVYFADPNLKTAVEAELGITNPTATEMLALTDLTANDKGIIGLTGLEQATNLKTLSLSGNQISDISALADLTKLIELDLGWNKINDITVLAGLNRLQYLSIHRNRISSISAITNLMSLKYLNLNGNPLHADSVNVYIPKIHQANPECEILLASPFDDFETGDFYTLDWKSSGDAEWAISTEAHSGNYCAQAGSISNKNTSSSFRFVSPRLITVCRNHNFHMLI